MRKKGLSEVVVRAVMSVYDRAKTRVRVRSAYSEEFEVEVGLHQGPVLLPLLFQLLWTLLQKKQEGVWLMNYCMQVNFFS